VFKKESEGRTANRRKLSACINLARGQATNLHTSGDLGGTASDIKTKLTAKIISLKTSYVKKLLRVDHGGKQSKEYRLSRH